MRDTVCANSK